MYTDMQMRSKRNLFLETTGFDLGAKKLSRYLIAGQASLDCALAGWVVENRGALCNYCISELWSSIMKNCCVEYCDKEIMAQ